MRRRSALVFGLVFIAAGCAPAPVSRATDQPMFAFAATPGCYAPPGSDTLELVMLREVNAERAMAGLAALRLDRRLGQAAQMHACDNAAAGMISHTGRDGSGVGERARRAGYSYRVVAENLGLGIRNPSDAVMHWMQSPGHRRNILRNDVREAGMGLAPTSTGRMVWVLVLGAPR